MTDQKVRLIYPPSLINIPVIHTLIKKYDLTVNIYRAEINPDNGWIEILISGDQRVLESAFSWLKEQGIDVQSIIG